jgi:hypothetical protein
MPKHPFRFEKGDRVQHVTWKGFVGTVVRGDVLNIYVEWDNGGMRVGNGRVAPSAFPANFEIRHLDDASE